MCTINCISDLDTWRYISMLGPEYVGAKDILIILCRWILPFSIVMNAISKLNYWSDWGKLILLGFIEVLVFLSVFFILVPLYGTLEPHTPCLWHLYLLLYHQ